MYKIKCIIFVISLATISCKYDKKKQEQVVKPLQIKYQVEKPFANPSFVYGSSFALFFQSIYRVNNFELMLAFTAEKTLAKFGRKDVLNYYQHNFKFDYKLGQLTNISYAGDTMFLTYAKAYIFSTRKKVVIPCHLENDSIKIILHNLNKDPFE